MKKILLSICVVFFTIITSAQTCPEIEGYSPITIRFGINESNFPTIPLYWNRFYKVDPLTGILNPQSCTYTGDPNLTSVALCACIVQGAWFRRVTDVCDPTPCGGDVSLPVLPITNPNTPANSWSQGSAWLASQIPDVSSSIAVMITKDMLIDADVNLSKGHWLIFNAGNSSILTGQTVTDNSVIQVFLPAQLENFGTIKGSGQIIGSLTNSGTISPGNSPGKITITGNYTATSSAIQQVEIAAADIYDTLVVTRDSSFAGGYATLGGTLNISLLNGFIPVAGDAFKIITGTSVTGTFANINLPVLPAGLTWTINYNTTDITLNTTASALPVNFIYTKALRQNNSVQVEWQTANEINVKNYEIEKSADGIHFTAAGTLNAKGTAANNYSWIDISPANGNNYYRIKEIDADSKFMYSGIVLVNMTVASKISVYPNPVKRNESLQVDIQNKTVSRMEIINTIGQVLYSQSGNITGTVNIPVSSSWATGQYLLRMISENKIELQKIVVQ
jgi:Secretion system C-terminal sorting domain